MVNPRKFVSLYVNVGHYSDYQCEENSPFDRQEGIFGNEAHLYRMPKALSSVN